MKSKYAGKLIVVGVLIVLIVIGVTRDRFREQELAMRGKLIHGDIIEYGRKPKTGSWFSYSYSVNGITYSRDDADVNVSYELIEYLDKKDIGITVLYDSINPEESDGLITELNFKIYNRTFPQSLNWLYDSGWVAPDAR